MKLYYWMPNNTAHKIAKALLQIKAIKLNPRDPFTWASGMRSPIYCDNRIALSHPKERKIVKQGLFTISGKLEPFSMIAGVATAGIPHGAFLANELNAPFCYVRNKPKAHGRKNLIEGALEPGTKVLVVEDLISTGGSALEAVKAIRDYGCEVAGVLAIFTYGFPVAEEAFEKANCPYATLTDYPTVLKEAVKEKYISEKEQAILSDWRNDPKGWYAKNF